MKQYSTLGICLPDTGSLPSLPPMHCLPELLSIVVAISQPFSNICENVYLTRTGEVSGLHLLQWNSSREGED